MNSLIKTCRLDEIFDVVSGHRMVISKTKNGKTSLIGTSTKNNGVIKYIKSNEIPAPGNTLSIAEDGESLTTFYQSKIFYLNDKMSYLQPKKSMILNEFMFYKAAIEMHKPYFSYGRKANQSRIRALQIPTRSSIPDWVYEIDIEEIKGKLTELKIPSIKLDVKDWKEFKVADLFDIFQGKQLNKYKQKIGNIAFIGSSEQNNGVTSYISSMRGYTEYENALTVSGDGSVGKAFYHPYKFIPTNFMNVLTIKDNTFMTKEIGVFLITIFELLRFKYSYGRKMSASRLKKEIIRLPVNNGEVDWEWIEDYMEGMVDD